MILLLAPVIVIVPAPPLVCVNVPEPDVTRFPATVMELSGVSVMPLLASVRLLNVLDPLPVRIPFGPFMVMVLVAPVNVPLFVQFAPTGCVNAPPLNVVPPPRVTLPLNVIAAPAVKETDAPGT